MEDMIPIDWSPENLEIGDAVGILVTPQRVMQLSLGMQKVEWPLHWAWRHLSVTVSKSLTGHFWLHLGIRQATLFLQ